MEIDGNIPDELDNENNQIYGNNFIHVNINNVQANNNINNNNNEQIESNIINKQPYKIKKLKFRINNQIIIKEVKVWKSKLLNIKDLDQKLLSLIIAEFHPRDRKIFKFKRSNSHFILKKFNFSY